MITWTSLESNYDGSNLPPELLMHDADLTRAEIRLNGDLLLVFKTRVGATALLAGKSCAPMLWTAGVLMPTIISEALIDTYIGWEEKGMATIFTKEKTISILNDIKLNKTSKVNEIWMIVFSPIIGDGFVLAGTLVDGSPLKFALLERADDIWFADL